MDRNGASTVEQFLAGDSVVGGALVQFDSSAEAEHLQRLLADRDLVLELGLSGYKGRLWQRFATPLANYGLIVLRSWISTGTIFLHCAKKGIGGLDRDRFIPRDEAEEMAIGTVGQGIEKFRDRVLIPGKWDHTKGATIKTYFIGQCVFQFPNVYRTWLHNTAPPPTFLGQPVDGRPGIINVDALQHLQALEEIDAVTDEIATMAAGDYMGYTHDEIAKQLGTTPRSVESKLWRHRQKVAEEASVKGRSKP